MKTTSSKPVNNVPVHRQDSELQCARTFSRSSAMGLGQGVLEGGRCLCCRIWPASLAQEERSVPFARAVGMGTARSRAGSGAWPMTTPAKVDSGCSLTRGSDPLLPGPEEQHWGRDWSPRVWLDPDSRTKPSTMGSRTSAQSPLPALPWLPGSLLILQPSLSCASQQNSRHKSFLRASGSLEWQPVSPSRSWQPNIAASWPKEPLGIGWPRPAAHQPSHSNVPSLAGAVRWHTEAQAVLTTLPSVGCLCQRLLPEGSFQESAASPVPGWFYTPQGWDNVRKSPERGMRPEALGQRGLRPEISYSRSESSDNSEGPGCL